MAIQVFTYVEDPRAIQATRRGDVRLVYRDGVHIPYPCIVLLPEALRLLPLNRPAEVKNVSEPGTVSYAVTWEVTPELASTLLTFFRTDLLWHPEEEEWTSLGE